MTLTSLLDLVRRLNPSARRDEAYVQGLIDGYDEGMVAYQPPPVIQGGVTVGRRLPPEDMKQEVTMAEQPLVGSLSVPRSWPAGVMPTPEEFRAWLLVLTTEEQLHILTQIMAAEQRGMQCWQADHEGEIRCLGERVQSLAAELGRSQADLRVAAKAFLEVSADRDLLRERLVETEQTLDSYIQSHP